MNANQQALDEAFRIAAQWAPAEPRIHTTRFKRQTIRYCPDCDVAIRPTPEGHRCACSQWRFAADDTAERRKLIGEDWKTA